MLPPVFVSRPISADQTQYLPRLHPPKLAGTERGITEPGRQPPLAWRGIPYLNAAPDSVHAEVLVKRMQAAGAQALSG